MSVQAPTLTTTRRPALLVGASGVAAAALAAGALAIWSGDDASDRVAPSPPVVSQGADERVLDGSPILRGTAAPVRDARVLDGSAILRGTATPPRDTRVLDGSPILRDPSVPHAGGGPRVVPSTTSPQFPERRPEGFHRNP